ncbi:MAG TPA: DUF5777 family beta-barrel protein [Puia sp.]|uniref:DUF5777 family beta-barrel protein n=1 Tax=Puia sp. TaxID=2045100 RepID=UPI002BB14A9B|nr:DUF5777 family beta-barrel protein [Puia sp.]HVU93578.1 DUF5777 family beta-barrel protein [Puia sp.]
MKNILNQAPFGLLKAGVCLPLLLLLLNLSASGQDDSASGAKKKEAPVRKKPEKNTFQSNWIIDNQTVMVPVKGTFEADIQHRFGTVQNGYKDLWGIYGASNIRLGFSYVPINNLQLGFGLSKASMLWDGSAKYAIIRQTKGLYPVSVTYYGNMAYKSVRDPGHTLFTYNTQRWSFFNQVIIARKVTNRFSVQVAASISHQNSVPGYYTSHDTVVNIVFKEEKFDLFTASVSARYRLTEKTCFIVDYDQPLTRFPTNNPHPNIAFGFEFNTSGHAFQLFAGNYSLLNPQQNSLYNSNNPFGYTETGGTKVPGGQFVIGFNITRLWNF